MFFDANENPFDNGLNRYPDPQQKELKALISSQKQISADTILLGNGSDEILDLLIRVFCEPNKDKLIILPPTYGMYEVLANVNAVEVVKIPLSETFDLHVDEILDLKNRGCKILFLCSPNNPTGKNFNKDAMERLIKDFVGIVVIDEAYIDFSKDESWLNRMFEFPNLVIIQTLSKAYGLAGIRLGICFASKEIISVLNRIKPPYNVNQLTQQTAIASLKSIDKINTEINIIIEERTKLFYSFKELNFVQNVYPTDANFILVKVDDANKRYRQLVDNGIIVRNRTNELLCENCLRITVGTPKENQKLISVLKSL